MKQEIKKLKEQLQVEVDAAFLYAVLAENQTNASTAKIFRELSVIENSHAEHILKKLNGMEKPGPSFKAKIQVMLAKILGFDFILSNLMNVEKKIAKASIAGKLNKGDKITGYELNHLRIIEAISANPKSAMPGKLLSKMEGRHKSLGGNALRAAVLGANDGLVSNMSLVMGVSGAAVSNATILITGVAGLLAGSISMALGEWLSVQSSRELAGKQIELEAEELESSPDLERKELSLIYQAKGMDEQSAEKLSLKVFENKEIALETLTKEELGIDQEELGGSAWEAAITSFFLFGIGAIIPVLPFLFSSSSSAIFLSMILSVAGLFLIGSAVTLFTGRSILFSGFRQVLFGVVAAAITYAIGRIIGVSLGG
jgi:VIT1/CCC1 family predicted Fe2+/Mn2+ transporter